MNKPIIDTPERSGKPLLIQMAGFPGSGKSTLALEISKVIDVIILDIDIIKSALIESGVGPVQVPKASYQTMFSLADFYLGQGRNVILDSPCRYPVTLEKGSGIARRHKADYKFIECRLESFKETNQRLKTRAGKSSQFTSANEEEFYFWLEKSQRPGEEKYLTVNTSGPVGSYIQKVIEYIGN